MMPSRTEVSGPMGSAASKTPAAAPKRTPTVWVTQASRDSLKVGWTAAMAPSMARMSRELVAP